MYFKIPDLHDKMAMFKVDQMLKLSSVSILLVLRLCR